MHVWKENIARIKDFYGSDYYALLRDTNSNYIRSICTALMEDPDAIDSELYVDKSEQLAGMDLTPKRTSLIDGDISLGMDAVCGWRKLYDLRNGDIEWLTDYDKIRSNLNAHMLWPRDSANTINTDRARCFNDRVDYTLFDIKRFYEFVAKSKDGFRGNTAMERAYSNDTTYRWLKKFGSFENLVQKMKLDCFCTDKYDVVDLSNPEQIITDYRDSYKNSVDAEYITNLIKAIA